MGSRDVDKMVAARRLRDASSSTGKRKRDDYAEKPSASIAPVPPHHFHGGAAPVDLYDSPSGRALLCRSADSLPIRHSDSTVLWQGEHSA